jgi:5-carboxymethyl-2-hydroxymuconate isomerase
MLNFCGIVAAILKMATARNFSMSGINSRHHNLPTYEMSLKSDNVEFVQYCGGHFEFLAIAIFKMAAEIQHCPILSKFDM